MYHATMKCKCGSPMRCNGYYRRVVYYLYAGAKILRPNKMRCIDCGKSRVEELEDVPVGSKYAWDVVERIVRLKQAGNEEAEIGRLIRVENQLDVPRATIARIVRVYGKGTL